MNDPNKQNTEPHSGECCSELKCETGLRNNYFEGKRLTADSFRVEQEYTLGRRRMLNRAIHGCGVVYGYGIDSHESYSGRLGIGPGLALDRCGRELIEGGGEIRFDDVFTLDRGGKRVDLDELKTHLGVPQNVLWDQITSEIKESIGKACWLLSAHYAEKDTAHIRIEDRCCCGRDEWDHVCEMVRYSLQQVDCDECCQEFGCELNCDCATGPCCGEPKEETTEPEESGDYPQEQTDAQTEQSRGAYEHSGESIEQRDDGPTETYEKDPIKSPHRGGCKCLCEHLTNLTIGGECKDLCTIKEKCGSVRVDVRNGVPLACVQLVVTKCGLEFGKVSDACGPRRLVKRNDLLFDLIRGCDLTRIADYGWKKWHRSDAAVPFADFKAAFGPEGSQEKGAITRDFWVRFSRPVKKDTVRRDSFVMTVIVGERDDGWWETLRVPIVRIDKPDGDTIDHATVVVSNSWLQDTLNGAASLFQGRATRVEVEVRGDFIVDCNGQTIDANARGRTWAPTGNGTPGGTFLSTFRVEPAPTPSRPVEDDSEEERTEGVS